MMEWPPSRGLFLLPRESDSGVTARILNKSVNHICGGLRNFVEMKTV
jgi:hypothetical protein